ncbi:DNA-binding protein [Desemzia sp. RIT804]|uniref:DNA-binding protein n=1 Tax=Desemzia sp. RIT 804 TaxID=2810209 RepID=UPI001950A683|nr:DNA-binding protein [Desemzia sp. RIT 804]MBM6614578.1 DNA-binding protein [Desemzia sp. RIT 804]
MDYITTKEAASKWGISDRMVLYHGAIKIGNIWLIPKNSTKPIDKRKRGENK